MFPFPPVTQPPAQGVLSIGASSSQFSLGPAEQAPQRGVTQQTPRILRDLAGALRSADYRLNQAQQALTEFTQARAHSRSTGNVTVDQARRSEGRSRDALGGLRAELKQARSELATMKRNEASAIDAGAACQRQFEEDERNLVQALIAIRDPEVVARTEYGPALAAAARAATDSHVDLTRFVAIELYGHPRWAGAPHRSQLYTLLQKPTIAALAQTCRFFELHGVEDRLAQRHQVPVAEARFSGAVLALARLDRLARAPLEGRPSERDPATQGTAIQIRKAAEAVHALLGRCVSSIAMYGTTTLPGDFSAEWQPPQAVASQVFGDEADVAGHLATLVDAFSDPPTFAGRAAGVAETALVESESAIGRIPDHDSDVLAVLAWIRSRIGGPTPENDEPHPAFSAVSSLLEPGGPGHARYLSRASNVASHTQQIAEAQQALRTSFEGRLEGLRANNELLTQHLTDRYVRYQQDIAALEARIERLAGEVERRAVAFRDAADGAAVTVEGVLQQFRMLDLQRRPLLENLQSAQSGYDELTARVLDPDGGPLVEVMSGFALERLRSLHLEMADDALAERTRTWSSAGSYEDLPTVLDALADVAEFLHNTDPDVDSYQDVTVSHVSPVGRGITLRDDGTERRWEAYSSCVSASRVAEDDRFLITHLYPAP